MPPDLRSRGPGIKKNLPRRVIVLFYESKFHLKQFLYYLKITFHSNNFLNTSVDCNFYRFCVNLPAKIVYTFEKVTTYVINPELLQFRCENRNLFYSTYEVYKKINVHEKDNTTVFRSNIIKKYVPFKSRSTDRQLSVQHVHVYSITFSAAQRCFGVQNKRSCLNKYGN